MYAYVELSNVAHTDSIIQSLSWMNYVSTPLPSSTDNENPTPSTPNPSASINYADGWLATGNTNHIVSVTYTSIRDDEHLSIPDRTNFNLRAHRSEVRFVSWNVPFQKLATVDEKGVIFVWVKHENRWSLELINDRSHPVVDMSWSYDGRMTVICYEDGYVLVGSVTGQRYWSTMVNTAQAKISAVAWTPDVTHVLLGTTSGNLILMDHHGNTTADISLTNQAIRQLIYSCKKFYPDAPDTNATKFVNDDYILACSLENGQILFLTHYDDLYPVTVNTDLQNIKMDWSSSNEILVVGGWRFLADASCHNEIQFYTRQGEFLYRLVIPQTVHSLSALCWAHDKGIVFVACGSYVYTIWVTHKAIPSMLTLCQMKIKKHLLRNTLENLEHLALPNNLQENLLHFYRSTIKGFLPDPRTLRSFVCNPLKSHLRLQCTMKRFDPESDNPSNRTNPGHSSGAHYVLYLEYLGGLIPLLRAKRVSKICPDFIIFDPQMNQDDRSVGSPSSKRLFRVTNLTCSTATQTISSTDPRKTFNANRSTLMSNRNSIYVAEHAVQQPADDSITHQSSSGCSSENDSDDDFDEEHGVVPDRSDQSSRKTSTSKIVKHKHNHKLCTIAANIWGTRFKFYGHANCLPEVLGSVTYKTSFLHLQPRQMTVTVANTSQMCKSTLSREEKRTTTMEKTVHKPVGKAKQVSRKKIAREDEDDTMNAVSSSKLNLTANAPIAPMSPQIPTVRPTTQVSQQAQASSSTKKLKNISSNPILRSQRASMTTNSTTTGMIVHPRHRAGQADSSAANSSSTSPINMSRSTSPAASVANFIRPISPPCIQVKEPLSPKFARSSATTMSSQTSPLRHRSPPPVRLPPIANNIDASTASATTTLLIDDSSGYDSSENQNQRLITTANPPTTMSLISTVPESCFEPETYRNLSPLTTMNSQKKLSFSDPTLNQISRVTTQTTAAEQAHLSAASLPRQESNEEREIHSDEESEELNTSDDRPSSKEKSVPRRNRSRPRYSSPRHRMMTCTSGIHDSLPRLSPASDDDHVSNSKTDHTNETSFYVMQNRPPLWNEQSQVYQLDFGGRVTLESAKNFQIEFKGKQVIQFGRIENNCYTLDFEWPFSPLQAFAVALANITQRLK